METKQEYMTHAQIIQRVPKTDNNIYGVISVTDIPVDKVCIVALGGERTETMHDANYYASQLNQLIDFYKLRNINIYSVYYDFEEHSSERGKERLNAFTKARSAILKKHLQFQPVNTNYVSDLYKIIIRPRIADQDGKKLSDEQAIQNIRNCILYTHCHGATPVRAFQEMMYQDMRNLGYNARVISNIMKNLLVIQHAPVSPLEKSKFNTISFMSANDTLMNFHNTFSEYVYDHNEDLLPSYFYLGNFFAVYGFTYQLIDEHRIVGLVPTKEQDILTPDGAIIMAAERNAIINALKAAKSHRPVPTINKLIAPTSKSDAIRPDFDTLARNGKFFMDLMYHDLHTNTPNER